MGIFSPCLALASLFLAQRGEATGSQGYFHVVRDSSPTPDRWAITFFQKVTGVPSRIRCSSICGTVTRCSHFQWLDGACSLGDVSEWHGAVITAAEVGTIHVRAGEVWV